jgi:16S rRNA (guanine966-N2)-methyltransferase
VAGAARGRPLVVPVGRATRPTSDRVREAIFSTVESVRGGLGGARVLDLYAGSGALGLEALSRGAVHVFLVESDARAARVIRGNIASLGLEGADVAVGRVERIVAGPPPAGLGYDLLLADPPYAIGDPALRAVLATAADNGWLATDALLVVERATTGGQFDWPPGVLADRSRRYGETTVWYGRRAEQPERESSRSRRTR